MRDDMVSKLRVNCLKTLKKLSICLPGKTPSAPSDMDGVGMTHGEGVETMWSHSTSLATWSRENGPTTCHLVLDDHWMGWNWRKTVGLCKFSDV